MAFWKYSSPFFKASSVPIVASFKVKLVSLGVNGASPCQAHLLVRCHLDLDLIRNRLCHFVLQGQDVLQVAIVAFSPKVPAVAASINCAVTRTRLPERATVPSTTPSTFNSRAISGSVLRVPL